MDNKHDASEWTAITDGEFKIETADEMSEDETREPSLLNHPDFEEVFAAMRLIMLD